MKYLVAGCIIAIGSAASANDQLALNLGLEPGIYTTAELVRIKTAMEDNNATVLQAALHRADVVVSTQSMGRDAGAGNDQLARNLGLEPGTYTAAELARIKTAVEDNNASVRRAALQKADVVVSTQSIGGGTGGGWDQIARILGVDPSAHTGPELAYMFFDFTD